MSKSKLILACILLLTSVTFQAQHVIHGKVIDKRKSPIIGANVYIKGTIDGASTDIDGAFSFKTETDSIQTLVVSCIGFNTYELNTKVSKMQHLIIVLNNRELGLDEIVITASTFSVGKSTTLKKMDALDVVFSGGSNGDIFGALQSLPGTQKVGEDGKLYIRGGGERETQTFIDGMHVLFPYTSTAENIPSRSRFSSFLFKGINFSMGGYDSEYGQALSSVLPMETKDVASTKLGVNITPVSTGGGGTYSRGRQSLSANVNLMDLGLYNSINPDNYNWKKDYRNIAAEMQLKTELGRNSIHKLFFSADKTSFIRTIHDDLNNNPDRNFGLNKDNYYINSTFTTRTSKNLHLFLGSAYSKATNNYNNALYNNDQVIEDEDELHLKFKTEKSISKSYKIKTGVESYLKNYKRKYFDTSGRKVFDAGINQNLYSSFIDNQFKLVKNVYTNLSVRLEYSDLYKALNVSPRFSINYVTKTFQLSGIIGKYYQSHENMQLISNNQFDQPESSIHYILGGSYDLDGTLLKLETYSKHYEGLGLLDNDVYTTKGSGTSQGIDFYISGKIFKNKLDYTLSYSYNDSKRLFKDYPIESTPTFATKHNLSVSLKYSIPTIRAYFGMAYNYTSGRPYQNPNKSGYINSYSPNYHSLDLNITYLLSKSVILYAYATNLLGRKNIYGYNYSNTPGLNGIYASSPIVNARKQFYFVGIFISLKSESAYDVSSF